MSSLEAVDHRLTFDDILEAVQDSKRGRWFLKEFEQRLHKQDTSSILQAIAKLEARMDGFGVQAGQPDELAKVKAAIANARNDLLKLGVGKEALSKEGQMFAELAEMARKAMPAADESSSSVVRTLQLVAEIEKTIAPAVIVDQSSKFFSADENLFERRAAPAKPAIVPAAPVEVAAAADKTAALPKEEPVATGAKLIIRKASGLEPASADSPPPVHGEQVASAIEEIAPLLPAPMAQEDISAIDTPRIVIVRRKAEDMPEVEVESAA